MEAIFISYRRDDAEGQAGRLYDDLIAEFGPNSVFMDVAAIEPGRDFRKAIDRSLSLCGAFLSVIGKNWLSAQNASGQRRLDDSADFVRLETASALKRDIPVIPVLVQGASMPRTDQLPDELKDLAYRNAMELTHPRWESDVQILIKALRSHLSSNRQDGGAISAGRNRAAKGLRSKRLLTLIAVILIAAVGVAFYLRTSATPKPVRDTTMAKAVEPARIAVPDLQGKPLESAARILAAAHLALGAVKRTRGAATGPDTVIAQSVAAGEQVPARTAIDVTVAVTPEPASDTTTAKPVTPQRIAVPDLQGKTRESARAALDAEHLALGKVTTQGAAVTPGTVIAQSVAAGERVPYGTAIDVTVAATLPSACQVESVALIGASSSPMDALAKIRIRGFDASLAGQEVTIMLDFMSATGGNLLERRLETHAQNTIMDVSSASNVYISGVRREDIRDVKAIQAAILPGWISKVGKRKILCKAEVPAHFE